MRRLLLVGATTLGLLLGTPTAFAAWASVGADHGAVQAAYLQVPAAPTVTTETGGAAKVSWPATMLSDGSAASGYVVRRHIGATTTTVCTTAALTCTDPAPQPSQTYAIVATTGSWSSAEGPQTTYLRDTTPPTTSAATSPSAPNGTNGWFVTSPVGVTLTATDPDSGVARIEYRFGAGAWQSVTGSTANLSVNAQGATTITYRAVDQLGNVESNQTLVVRIDTGVPGSPAVQSISSDTGSSSTDRITRTATQTVSGTAEANSTVRLYRGAGGTLLGTTTATGAGSWTMAGVALAEGSQALVATATDVAGNVSGASAGLSVTLDTLVPTGGVAYPGVVNMGVWTNNGCSSAALAYGGAGVCGTASGTGTALTGTITYELRNVTAGTCWNGTTMSAANCGTYRATTGTSPRWLIPAAYNSLTSGSYEVRLVLTDVAGNSTSSSPVVATFTKP